MATNAQNTDYHSLNASTATSMHEQTQTIQQVTTTTAEATVRLTLKNPRKANRVNWAQNTVDNENLNRKKSKCCCVYEKPRNWNESSSEDENEDKECHNCRKHRKTDYNREKQKEESNNESNQCSNVNSN